MSSTAQTVIKAELTAVVTRNDGTKQDLGVIAYYHRNPLKRLLHAIKQNFK